MAKEASLPDLTTVKMVTIIDPTGSDFEMIRKINKYKQCNTHYVPFDNIYLSRNRAKILYSSTKCHCFIHCTV